MLVRIDQDPQWAHIPKAENIYKKQRETKLKRLVEAGSLEGWAYGIPQENLPTEYLISNILWPYSMCHEWP